MTTNEELVKRYQDGDIFALNDLTEQNMRLIQYIANKYYTDCSFIDKEDLVQTGWIGFYEAIQRYDPDHPKAAKFSTYSIFWIRQAISRYLNQKVPKGETSLHVPIGEDGETLWIDMIEDKDDDSFLEMWHRLENRELHNELEDVINKNLSLKHREIIHMRYGWNELREMQFTEIGELYDTSHQVVQQQHNQALRKLRQTKWARVRAVDIRKEIIAKLEYKDPLAALMAKHGRHGIVETDDLIYPDISERG